MKKLIAVILMFTSLFALSRPVRAAQPSTIIPQYVSIKSATVFLSIDEGGIATVTLYASGNTDTSQIKAVTHLERLVGGKWYLVYIGGPETSWEDISYSATFNQVYTAGLSSAGTYRAVTEFTVTGTTVEVITKTAQATY